MLIVVPHPDDSEGSAGGTAALYRQKGHRAKFLSMTNGDTGHYSMGGMQPARMRKRSTKEARRSTFRSKHS